MNKVPQHGILVHIDAPHFYAGLIVYKGKCIFAADIIKYMVGKDREWIVDYCRRKEWEVSVWSTG